VGALLTLVVGGPLTAAMLTFAVLWTVDLHWLSVAPLGGTVLGAIGLVLAVRALVRLRAGRHPGRWASWSWVFVLLGTSFAILGSFAGFVIDLFLIDMS
jgi:hypothetical protein